MKKQNDEKSTIKKNTSDKCYLIDSVIEALKQCPEGIVQNINSISNALKIPKVFSVLVNIGYICAIIDIIIDDDDEVEFIELLNLVKKYKEEYFG